PNGIFVNQQTGEIWVADTANFRAVRYPSLDNIVRGNTQATVMSESTQTIAVAQDQFGDLYVMDASNRIVVHYPAVLAVNGANYLIPTGTTNPNPLAPGMIAAICPPLRPDLVQACRPDDLHQFGEDSATYKDLPNPVPLPTTLADTQVFINGVPA